MPKSKSSYVYFVQGVDCGLIKIGRAESPVTRLRSLQGGSPEPLKILAVEGPMTHREAVSREADLHRRFREVRTHGEWFRPVEDLMQIVGQAPARVRPHDGVVYVTVGGLPHDPHAPGRDLIHRYLERDRVRKEDRADSASYVPTIADRMLAQAGEYGVADAAALDSSQGPLVRLADWHLRWSDGR